LPYAITQELTSSSSGALIPATENSKRPVTARVTHAGLATVIQYDLRAPAARWISPLSFDQAYHPLL